MAINSFTLQTLACGKLQHFKLQTSLAFCVWRYRPTCDDCHPDFIGAATFVAINRKAAVVANLDETIRHRIRLPHCPANTNASRHIPARHRCCRAAAGLIRCWCAKDGEHLDVRRSRSRLRGRSRNRGARCTDVPDVPIGAEHFGPELARRRRDGRGDFNRKRRHPAAGRAGELPFTPPFVARASTAGQSADRQRCAVRASRPATPARVDTRRPAT